MKRILHILVLLMFAGTGVSQASQDHNIYSKAVRAAKRGDKEMAFINYHLLWHNDPRSAFAEEALFAKGEYYYLVNNIKECTSEFDKFVQYYPDSKAKLFALVYLWQSAIKNNDPVTAQKVKEGIIDCERLGFVFKDNRRLNYTSPLNRNFSAIFYINRVEFYVEGTLFAKIIY